MWLTRGLHRSPQRHPWKTAFVWGGRRQSWREAAERAAALAAVPHDLERGARELRA